MDLYADIKGREADEKHSLMWAMRRKKSLLKYRHIEPTPENIRKLETSEPKSNPKPKKISITDKLL